MLEIYHKLLLFFSLFFSRLFYLGFSLKLCRLGNLAPSSCLLSLCMMLGDNVQHHLQPWHLTCQMLLGWLGASPRASLTPWSHLQARSP